MYISISVCKHIQINIYLSICVCVCVCARAVSSRALATAGRWSNR